MTPRPYLAAAERYRVRYLLPDGTGGYTPWSWQSFPAAEAYRRLLKERDGVVTRTLPVYPKDEEDR